MRGRRGKIGVLADCAASRFRGAGMGQACAVTDGVRKSPISAVMDLLLGLLVSSVVALPFALRDLKIGLMIIVVATWALYAIRVRHMGLSRRVFLWWCGLIVVACIGAVTGYLRGSSFSGIREGLFYIAIYPTLQLILAGAAQIFDAWRGLRYGLIAGALLSSALILIQFLHVMGYRLPDYAWLISFFPEGGLSGNPNRNFGLTGANSYLPRSVGYHVLLAPYLILLGATVWAQRRRVWAVILWAAEIVVVAVVVRRAIWIAAVAGPIVGWFLLHYSSDKVLARRVRHGLVLSFSCLLLVWTAPTWTVLMSSGNRVFQSMAGGRVAHRKAEKKQADPRLLQLRVLSEGILERPWLGHGFGAVVPAFADRGQTPWRYELWYLGLGYQVGLVGLMMLAAGPIMLWWSGFRRWRFSKGRDWHLWIQLATAACAWPLAGTNPYLATFGGQLILFVPLWGWLAGTAVVTNRVAPQSGACAKANDGCNQIR